MKILNKIIIPILCILLVISLSLNIILAISYKNLENNESDSTIIYSMNTSGNLENTKIILANDYESIKSAYLASNSVFNDAVDLTFFTKNYASTTTLTESTTTCSITSEGIITNCSMMSKLTDLEGTIMKESFFPGDGYKYTIEGNSKTKSVSANTVIENYFYNLVIGILNYLDYLNVSEDFASTSSFTYVSEINVNYAEFSLISKKINCSYNSTSFTLSFDSTDRVTGLYFNENTINNLTYELTQLNFPSFEGFIEQ